MSSLRVGTAGVLDEVPDGHEQVERSPGDADLLIARTGGSQDTMGFTVVGPDRFLGSGHPTYGPLIREREPHPHPKTRGDRGAKLS